MEPDAQPRRRVPVWGMVIAAIVLTVLIAVGAFALWFRSDSDLKAADAAAHAAGLPATWGELGLVSAPPATLAALDRIDVLAKTLKSWQDSTPSGGTSRKWSIGEPLPDGMAEHHAALPTAELAELLGLLDGLGDVAPVRRTTVNASTLLPELSTWKYLCRLMSERVVLALPHDLPAEAHRLVRVVRAMPGPETLISHLVRVSMATVASQALVRRLADLRGIEPRFSAAVLSLAEVIEANSRLCFTCEHLGMRETLSDRDGVSGWGLDRRFYLLQDILARAGRGAVLNDGLEWIRAVQVPGDLRSLLALARAQEATLLSRTARFSPGDYLLRMLTPARLLIVQKTATVTMRLRLLAAELDGTPWPEDVFAAPGTLLRRGERDGVLMFGYSVGRDGVDDGGDKRKDDGFPLYGPVEAPVLPAEAAQSSMPPLVGPPPMPPPSVE